MAVKLIFACLLAVALLGRLADAQYSEQPQSPHIPPKMPVAQQPLQPTETFHTCEVADHYKIQCGAPNVSASDCESINCCFDGRKCYYGKSVTLQCTKDGQFIVVVARDATLPSIDLESITFFENDESCRAVGTTSAFVIYQFPVTACGTVMMEEAGVIIYENGMSSLYEVAIGPYGAITRDSHYQLLVQCRYVGATVEALVSEVSQAPPLPHVAAPGPLRVDLRLANGQCAVKGCVEEEEAYRSFYEESNYPVTKTLRDPVYIEIQMLGRTDPNLALNLGRCWTTSDPYPHSLPQWDLLIDGCPYRDDRYLTALVPVGESSGLPYPTHHRRFVFKMFTFVGVAPGQSELTDPEINTALRVKVYIHCEVAVCQHSQGNNCEPRCFRKRRDIADSFQKRSRSETTVVSSQEIIITT